MTGLLGWPAGFQYSIQPPLRGGPDSLLPTSLGAAWASLVAQMVKNQPAMRETWVQFLGREDPLEEGLATHSSIHAWRIPWTKDSWWVAVRGIAKNQTQLSD